VRREHGEARSLLDVACGAGLFLAAVREKAKGKGELVGVDFSKRALELARLECPEARLFQAPAEALPFVDEQFDCITCLGSLEHFLEPGKALSEMKRAAAPGARFFFLVPNIFFWKDILRVLFKGERDPRDQSYERFLSVGEWRQLLESSGFRILRVIKYNGIAHQPWKQRLKDLLIPLRFSYHFFFICELSEP
jgi:SAM-dependent methyltransferase